MSDFTFPSDGDATGRSFDDGELRVLQEVLDSGRLSRTRGTVTAELEQRLAAMVGATSCRATASGTAAIHTAVAAVNPEPGDEIITSPITDMGAITPILYQTAIPVFADTDPRTGNVTADAIAARVTDRTRAVIVTHLFGNPCDLAPIVDLCRAGGIVLIEDCAQAYGASYGGRPVGSVGDIGCFSLQQTKHITTGEGGFVVTSDPKFERHMRLFIDKAWGYGDEQPDHYFLALNYRITELQGAVATAQLEKLPKFLQQRTAMAERLRDQIADVPGIHFPRPPDGAVQSYWKIGLSVDLDVLPGGPDAVAETLRAANIPCAPGYVRKPAYECAVLRDHVTFGSSGFPFEGPHRAGRPPVIYDRAETPGAIRALESLLVLPWNEKVQEVHVDAVSAALRSAAREAAA